MAFSFFSMRYHYQIDGPGSSMYGQTYLCDHPVYSRCTLYLYEGLGLAVIQQRFDSLTKHTYWTELDQGLPDKLYLHAGFWQYFRKHAGVGRNGLYPTVTVRQIMWALRMKPLPKARWETVFDRKDI